MSTELERWIRLNLLCALAQKLIWCPVCGEVHMFAARCREIEPVAMRGILGGVE